MGFPRRSPLLAALALLILGALLPPATVAAEPEAPTPSAVDEALSRAVRWLVTEQEVTGAWGSGPKALGPTALATYAMLHAGVHEEADDRAGRALRRALRWLEREEPKDAASARDTGTYARSLLRLALDLRGRPADRPWCVRLTRQLVAAQSENGQWGYETPTRDPGPTGDNSNAQVAALALGVAAAAGDPVPREVLERAAAWWREHPQDDGGFGYASGGGHPSATSGSMTAAGIASLAQLAMATGRVDVLADDLAAALLEAEPVLAKAVLALEAMFRVDRNEGPSPGRRQARRASGRGWLHYYLWSVERAMVLAGRAELATLDWYTAGTEHLLETQAKDGSWRSEHPLYATCFAVLFLTRAADPPRAFTPRARAPEDTVTGQPPRAEGEAPDAPARPHLDLVAGVRGKATLVELLDAARGQGAKALLPLVPVLDDRDPLVRRRALEVLDALLPPERMTGVASHALARGRLRTWLARLGAILRLVDGRFVP